MNDFLSMSDIFDRKQKLKGDRLYEIVFAKIDEIEMGEERGEQSNPVAESVLSTDTIWKSSISESERTEFRGYLPQIRDEIEAAQLSQEERADALAALDAVDSLSDAPNPMWQIIAAIMSSPILMNITALVTLAVAVLKS